MGQREAAAWRIRQQRWQRKADMCDMLNKGRRENQDKLLTHVMIHRATILGEEIDTQHFNNLVPGFLKGEALPSLNQSVSTEQFRQI